MSGGSYDYAYSDAELLQNTIEEMAQDAEEDEDIPKHAAERLQELSDRLSTDAEIMQIIEWYKSGDYGSDTMQDELKSLGWL